MISRWIVTNITSASVTTFLAFLAGIISWSVYCTRRCVPEGPNLQFRLACCIQVTEKLPISRGATSGYLLLCLSYLGRCHGNVVNIGVLLPAYMFSSSGSSNLLNMHSYRILCL
jgi:hypothetical protein